MCSAPVPGPGAGKRTPGSARARGAASEPTRLVPPPARRTQATPGARWGGVPPRGSAPEYACVRYRLILTPRLIGREPRSFVTAPLQHITAYVLSCAAGYFALAWVYLALGAAGGEESGGG